jgi:hypothetical protein
MKDANRAASAVRSPVHPLAKSKAAELPPLPKQGGSGQAEQLGQSVFVSKLTSLLRPLRTLPTLAKGSWSSRAALAVRSPVRPLAKSKVAELPLPAEARRGRDGLNKIGPRRPICPRLAERGGGGDQKPESPSCLWPPRQHPPT